MKGLARSVYMLLALAGLVLVSPAHAIVTSVKVAPEEGIVPFNRPTTLRVVWTVETTLGAGTLLFSNGALVRAYDPAATASYCSTYFTIGGGDVSTPFALVARRVSASAGAGGVAKVRETIQVPASWLVWARKNGYRTLHYIRFFDDGTQTNCYVLKITLAGGGGFSAREFGLSYVRMRFDDDSIARVVEQGAELRVRAEVRYRGHGLLRAVWEVADPARTRSGKVLYTPIATVHRYLTGTGRTVLEGPALPTTLTGLHLVRLRLIEPAIDAPRLFLRYFVRARTAPPAALASIALRAPEPGAALGPETRFAWAPVEGAAAYRLEVYEAPVPGFAGRAGGATEPEEGARLVAGLLLDGRERSAALSALAASRLRGPAVYLWRVIAFGRDGRLVAASPYRRLVVAADAGSRARGDRDAGRD